MRNKKMSLSVFLFSLLVFMPVCARAEGEQVDAVNDETVVVEENGAVEDEEMMTEEEIAAEMENVSADAVAAYDASGSLFQQITDLEQEKVLMELEKERAQLNLELDKLAAEKIKLHMEIDELSGRAEQQQQELANAQAKLEAEAAEIERQKQELQAQTEEMMTSPAPYYYSQQRGGQESGTAVDFASQYRLINVIGAGSQLQAKIENLGTGQSKTISVGKVVDGYTVKSISLDEGIVFTNGDDTQTLSITKVN